MSNLVEIKELGKCYGKKKAMNNLSLSLESGRIIGILGPNGSGKSTLIKMMAGVLKPTSGQIIINGYPVGVDTKKIVSYLPERTYLNPSMKVKEAVDYFTDFYEDFSRQKALDMKYVLMAFDEGTGLTPHRAPGNAIVFALEGKATIGYEGKDYELSEGECFRFEKNGLHSVTANGKFKMALLLVLE